MPIVSVPSLMQNLTNGADKVTVDGETLREVIENLEISYPGFKARLCDGNRIRKNISLYIDGTISREGMRQPVKADTEIHFLPAISGGCSPVRTNDSQRVAVRAQFVRFRSVAQPGRLFRSLVGWVERIQPNP